ncbi:hypothetical protein VM1G_11596 [Cytospora mali]|uniref:Uncharacterized protein n=1 Tax=Cytospora mali TaxID=578113 RepID=A0A194W068_CYTMA|nr:hypothetical protein VM1G_11596 [Valsa mali]
MESHSRASYPRTHGIYCHFERIVNQDAWSVHPKEMVTAALAILRGYGVRMPQFNCAMTKVAGLMGATYIMGSQNGGIAPPEVMPLIPPIMTLGIQRIEGNRHIRDLAWFATLTTTTRDVVVADLDEVPTINRRLELQGNESLDKLELPRDDYSAIASEQWRPNRSSASFLLKQGEDSARELANILARYGSNAPAAVEGHAYVNGIWYHKTWKYPKGLVNWLHTRSSLEAIGIADYDALNSPAALAQYIVSAHGGVPTNLTDMVNHTPTGEFLQKLVKAVELAAQNDTIVAPTEELSVPLFTWMASVEPYIANKMVEVIEGIVRISPATEKAAYRYNPKRGMTMTDPLVADAIRYLIYGRIIYCPDNDEIEFIEETLDKYKSYCVPAIDEVVGKKAASYRVDEAALKRIRTLSTVVR